MMTKEELITWVDRKKATKRLLIGGLLGIGLSLFAPAVANANMCSPMNGPAGFLWPAIQSCQVYAPQLGGIPRVYTPPEQATVPYNPQVPQFVPLPPIPPGLLP